MQDCDALRAFRRDVESYAPHHPLDRYWRLARRYGVGIVQIAEFHKILTSEGRLYRICGSHGGYFKAPPKDGSG